MVEKRSYSRINTKINGSLYKDGYEIPVIIYNISEQGVGLRYKYKDCSPLFTVYPGERFVLAFFDENILIPDQNIQICNFRIKQLRLHTTHGYIGAMLENSDYDYPHYVENKRTILFTNALKYSGLAYGV